MCKGTSVVIEHNTDDPELEESRLISDTADLWKEKGLNGFSVTRGEYVSSSLPAQQIELTKRDGVYC